MIWVILPPMIIRLLIVLLSLYLPSAAAAQARRPLIILTSFPDSVYEPFRRAFEKAYPDTDLFILNRKTSSAISYIQDGAGHQVDLFWASAPDAFEILKAAGRLQKISRPLAVKHKTILGYPINDKDGYYTGFAISGYGFMWNPGYLQARKLPEPKSWNDLRRGIYKNHIAISAPSRSGTTHLIVEIILQSKGWKEGWKALLEIGGNLATVTARSYGVPSGVEQGQFGIGLVIDFFGLRSRAKGHGVRFRYPAQTMLLPANIAMTKGAKNTQAAKQFIEFLLSDQGQDILFQPAISRLPIKQESYSSAPVGFPNPFEFTVTPGAPLFDINASRRRYHLVNTMFDQLITFRLRELKDAWAMVHKAQNMLHGRRAPKQQAAIARARALIETIPVSAERGLKPDFAGLFIRHKPGFSVSKEQSDLEGQWGREAQARYENAAQIAEKVIEELASRRQGKIPQ